MGLFKGFVLLTAAGFGLRYVLQGELSWQHFCMLALMDTLIYVAIMYGWCMNRDERGLCRAFVQKLRGCFS